MPYRASKTLRNFNAQLDTITGRIEESLTQQVSSTLREYAIAASIFLAHAEMENYFGDSVSKVANIYSSRARKSHKLPARLRAHLIVGKLNVRDVGLKAALRADEPRLLASIESWFARPEHCLINDSKPLQPFSGADIYGSARYPSISNIKKVLQRLGVGDVENELNKIAGRNVVNLLESVASLRTSLAHTASLPGISPQDVVERLEGLRVFASTLDQLFYNHLMESVPDIAWRSEML